MGSVSSNKEGYVINDKQNKTTKNNITDPLC